MSHPETPGQPGEHAELTGAMRPWVVALFWLLVGAPLAWGIYRTVLQAAQLFR